MSDFVLDPRLQTDAHWVLDAPLSRLLLMNDARWPWLILVPRRAGLRELLELDARERTQCLAELDACAAWLRTQPQFHKLNIGALGNVVAQLHIHVIGRWPGDPAWPAPVWGVPGRVGYTEQALPALLDSVRTAWTAGIV